MYGLKLKGDFPPPPPGAIPILPVTGGGLEQSCQTNGNFWALMQGRTHRIVERAYSEEERQRLRPEWQTRVNDLGLLTSTEGGIKFKEISNTRVPEHAPFWVYRLHRLN